MQYHCYEVESLLDFLPLDTFRVHNETHDHEHAVCDWNCCRSQEVQTVDLRLGRDIEVKRVRINEVIKERRYQESHLKTPSAVDHRVAY